jgi:acyl-homoserine lactone acylase PvdQ
MRDERQIKIFESYTKGVNDYIASVSLTGDDASARLLPLEFYIFGIQDKIRPWEPTDVISLINLINLSLTWDWTQDFTREVIKSQSEEMRILAEELIPYNANFFYNLVSVLDDSDLKRMGKWSEKTLSERYFENLEKLRAAEPKRDAT